MVRNVGVFARFLELAAAESGYIVHFTKLSQELGVSHSTVQSYYQMLEDCLILFRINPFLKTKTRRQLVKSSKYIFFDLGVRRAAAGEGLSLPETQLGRLFQQWVGLQLLYLTRNQLPIAHLYYWRDQNGIEVDWVLEIDQKIIPIEVKWTAHPRPAELSHLRIFMKEYQCSIGYVIC